MITLQGAGWDQIVFVHSLNIAGYNIQYPESDIQNPVSGIGNITPYLKGVVKTGIEFTIYRFTIYDLVNIQHLESCPSLK